MLFLPVIIFGIVKLFSGDWRFIVYGLIAIFGLFIIGSIYEKVSSGIINKKYVKYSSLRESESNKIDDLKQEKSILQDKIKTINNKYF